MWQQGRTSEGEGVEKREHGVGNQGDCKDALICKNICFPFGDLLVKGLEDHQKKARSRYCTFCVLRLVRQKLRIFESHILLTSSIIARLIYAAFGWTGCHTLS